MSLKRFLKDKVYLIFTTLGLSVILSLFLFAIETSKSIILIINITIYALLFLELFVEFMRRYEYYNGLIELMSALEEKYLIFDMIGEKNFVDAEILQYLMKQGNYSMNQKLNLYKHSQEEYKNYIELWVHEIKTPLAALKLLLDNDKYKAAQDEVDEISYYIEQALYYARSTSVYKDYLIEDVDLEASIKKTIRQLSNNFIKKDISIDLELDALSVYSDSKWLEFIIKQILINSIKYTGDHGNINIKSTVLEQAVLLEIMDNGIGIREEDLPRVFELGFTGSSGRVYNQATGMGLYLVSELSKSLHINVKIESDDGVKVSLIIPKSNLYFKS